MTLLELVPHPDFPAAYLDSLNVEVSLEDSGLLTLTYELRGGIAEVDLPEFAEARRTDGLWQHSCFEAFVMAGGGSAYTEYNFATSTQWAAYDFDDYRAGMRDSGGKDKEMFFFVSEKPEALVLSTSIERPADNLRINLSAIIEAKDGTKSYWALRHPPGKPDFHHPDCFALQLPAPPAS